MNTTSEIADNDIIISGGDNNQVGLSINIDIASKVDFNKQDLWLFSEDKGEFIKIKPERITHIGFSSDSKRTATVSDLSFITKYFKHINSLAIVCNCENISSLNILKNLERISIHNKIKEKFDFSLFPHLKSVFLIYQKSLNSIFDCKNLSKLEIHKYSNKTFEKFAKLESLESLIIRQGSLSDVERINNLKNLMFFEISHNRSLTDLSPLSHNNSIRKLIIDCCSKIRNFNPISKMELLEELALENLKEIETLDFIKKMTSLNKIALTGRSVVLDGKLNWLLEHKNITLMSSEAKKHYDIKWEQDEYGNHILVSKK